MTASILDQALDAICTDFVADYLAKLPAPLCADDITALSAKQQERFLFASECGGTASQLAEANALALSNIAIAFAAINVQRLTGRFH